MNNNKNHVLFILLLLVQRVLAEGGVGNGKCIDQERYALLHFKAHILRDPHGWLSTWRVEKEEDSCKWSGVTCNNQTGHVTDLDLNHGGLEGEISPSLLNLTYLSYLDLSDNSFNGTIPKSIGSLTKLRSLDLSGNSFHRTIPKSIASLTELRDLDLSFNSFHGTIPKSIGYLTELRSLYLSGNNFNGTIPTSIGSLTQLWYFEISYNSFHGSIPKSICYLSELRLLDLSDNSFTGTIPPEFGNLTNLESLSIRDLERCTIENLDWLSRLSQMQYLTMSGTSLAKANNWVNVILSLPKLYALDLYDCELSQVSHPYSSSFNLSSSSSSSIVSLYLGNNNLNSSMYDWLFPLTSNNSLYTLDLFGNKLDMIPTYFGNLCSLTLLDLRFNSIVASFSDILKNLASCTSFTLQSLFASYNQITGSLSDDNQLNGSISEKVWGLPNLQNLDLSSNSLRGPISQSILNSKIVTLNLSNNTLIQGVPSKAHMPNLSYVEDIDLSSCKLLGPHFPKWIQKLVNLISLDISNTGISDTIPTEFWNMWPSQLTYLNLSSNYLYGPVSNVPSTLNVVDLSSNRFSGGIFFLCKIVDGFLTHLDLSHNSFSGQLPDCLWHFKYLVVLNLGNNRLSGRIPRSVDSLIRLEVLVLYNNTFSGELPLSLKNCTRLNFLDLGENNFSGNLPVWIGENLSGLYALSLKSNNFSGPIPLQLCQLVHLQILDLSKNHLYGTIPSCVNNLTFMVQKGLLSTRAIHIFSSKGTPNISQVIIEYVDHEMIQWQGNIQEFSTNLLLLKSIDLSSNNLTGKIPYELTDLHGLVALNLSKNTLIGEIPQSVGQMKELLILDLSRNSFSGKIPSSISQMALLSYLDVSYNNLSGRVPTGSQLQTFEPSWFAGNAELCGLPATNHCQGDEKVPPTVGESEDREDVEDDLEIWFYIGGASGFATGFWIVCSALLLNRRGRHAFFSFLDNSRDWVYVKVMVFIAKSGARA